MAFKEPVNGLYKMSEEPKLALTNLAFKRASIFGFLQPNSLFNDEIVKKPTSNPPVLGLHRGWAEFYFSCSYVA